MKTPKTRRRTLLRGRLVGCLLAIGTVGAIGAAAPLAQATTAQTTRVSVSSSGAQADGDYSNGPSISGDGRFVAFDSDASNLVANDTNGESDVFVRDRRTGKTERISVSSAGAQGGGESFAPAISGNGRFVAFASSASNLVPGDTNGNYDIFLHDLKTHRTTRVSVSSAGAQGNNSSFDLVLGPSISADGRLVAFESQASNLVHGDSKKNWDVFVHDRETHRTQRVSVSSAGAAGHRWSGRPSISENGRFVAFVSANAHLVPHDTNQTEDVFVRDLKSHATRRVSVSSAGRQANRWSGGPSISANGRFVAFPSTASNLVRGDTNGYTDVFVRDRKADTTRRVSVSSDGTQASFGGDYPAISANGRFVAFDTYAADLVPDDTNDTGDIFVRDLVTRTTERVSVSSAGAEGNNGSRLSSISGDGSFVAFASSASNLVPDDTNGNTEDVFVRGPLH